MLLHRHQLDRIVAQPGNARQHIICKDSQTFHFRIRGSLLKGTHGIAAITGGIAADKAWQRLPTFEVGVGSHFWRLRAHANVRLIDPQRCRLALRPLVLPAQGRLS